MKKNKLTALMLGVVMLISASGCSSADFFPLTFWVIFLMASVMEIAKAKNGAPGSIQNPQTPVATQMAQSH